MKEWIKTEEQLPPERKYVIGRCRAKWLDDDDPENVNVVVVKLIKGISLKERSEMDNSNPRKKCYRSEDEYGNNERSYYWETFGTTTFFGQDMIEWKFIN